MNNKSLYNSLAEYAKTDNYPFHMPGHKRNGEIINMVNPYEIDITEIDDFDDLHHSNGLIQNISERICKSYDALYGNPQVTLLYDVKTVDKDYTLG